MTRRFKVFVALNLAGFIGLAAWLRSDISPPDQGDLVMDEEPVPEEDNALPHYLRFEQHMLRQTSNGLHKIDAEGWEILREAMSLSACQRKDWDALDTDQGHIIDKSYRLVRNELRSMFDAELQAQNWAGADSILQGMIKFNHHMEKYELNGWGEFYALPTRHMVLGSLQKFSTNPSLPGRWLDVLAKRLIEVPPAPISYASYLHSAFQHYDRAIVRLDDYPGAFQPNRTRAALIQYFHLHFDALNTPLNSGKHERLGRSRPDLEKLHKSQGRIRAIICPNVLGEHLLMRIMADFQRMPNRCCLAIVQHDLARALIASLRYQRDHGNLPSRLEDLVPTYLPSVPPDAYDGLPLGYDPASGLLFSRWPLKQDGKPELGEDVLTKTPTTHPARANDSTVLQIPASPP